LVVTLPETGLNQNKYMNPMINIDRKTTLINTSTGKRVHELKRAKYQTNKKKGGYIG